MVLAKISYYPSSEGSPDYKEVIVSPFLVQKMITDFCTDKGLVPENLDLLRISIHFINITE